jgi:hypothetical protein
VNDLLAQFPWERLYGTEGAIPWPALEVFADALPGNHDLVEALFDAYDKVRARPFEEPKYADLYMPAIFALAAPRLSEEQRREIGDFLVGRLVEAGKEDDDLALEVLTAACGSMGPVIVPTVLDAAAKESDARGSWFFLWSLTGLAAKTQDSAIRATTAQACAALLARIDLGEIDDDMGIEAAWTLALLGRTEYVDLLLQLSGKCSPILGGGDYEEAARRLQGIGEETTPWPELWELPVHEWLDSHWKWARDWFAKQQSDYMEPENVEERQARPLAAAFMKSPWARNLPADLLDNAYFITSRLLEYATTYEGVSPEELDEATLRAVLLDLFPRKISKEREFFAGVAPVTEAFLGWMASEGLLADAQPLMEAVRRWADEIVETAMDPGHWGPAKTQTMKALRAGVDVADESALQDFLYEQALQSLEQKASDQTDSAPLPRATPIIEHATKIGRNDPCPCGSGKKYKKCCGSPTKDQTVNT